jgi:hypothetical protein
MRHTLLKGEVWVQPYNDQPDLPGSFCSAGFSALENPKEICYAGTVKADRKECES